MSQTKVLTSDSTKSHPKRFSFIQFNSNATEEERSRYDKIGQFMDSRNLEITNLETIKCYPSISLNEPVTELKVKSNPILLRRLKKSET